MFTFLFYVLFIFRCGVDGSKSAAKCQEYSKFVFSQDFAMGGGLSNRMSNISECHQEAVPLIVGGVLVATKEVPHMVAIGFGDSIDQATWMCGGSLISEEWVLTAAHCVHSRDQGEAHFARMGVLDLKDEASGNLQDFKIIERIVHPDYHRPSRYNDIALFKLDKPVKFDGYSRPACLNTQPDFNFKKALATGWGKLDYNDAKGSSALMKVALSLVDKDTCNRVYKLEVGGPSMQDGVRDSQLCAGDLAGGKDTCQGDSGGPLHTTLDEPYCMYSIIGVTSFGKICASKNSAAIYSRVSHYMPWIESVVWP